MISSRKANPYYTGVVARFGNGGKHSLHDKDLSSSSARRRSLVSVGSERSKVGTEAATSRDKLNAPAHTKSSSTDARRPSPTSSSVSSIGADVKDTHTAQRSNQPAVSATPSPAVGPSGSRTAEVGESQKKLDRPNLRIGTPSTDTSWSKATGAATDVGTIPDSASSAVRTDSVISHAMTSYESHDSDSDNETPSVSTVSSRMVQSYRDQGVVITESWVNEEPQIDINNSRPPTLYIQRPSMDVSILPAQPPFQSVRRMSTASSILSSISNGGRSDGLKRFTQWSEHSHDPSAPLRWDELFEMDPSSRGPLWLSHRGLGQIPHEFFDGLRNLRELYLDHNDIKVVPDSLLKLSKLDVLDLSCNSISSFDTAFKLKKLKNLRRLNLDHNLLTDISPIYKLKSLRELRMNHNFVPYLAIAINNLTKLKILSMESNSIAMLPETMGKLGNLCELRLSGNNLRTLPDSIGAIRTLQVLALRSNLLEKLPESWKDMENLSTLDLACNHLTSLPADIVRLPRLTHLDLHDNQIRALPEKIGQLSNLVVLQLCNNQLQELPKDIGRLRDLHDLVLSFNQLHSLPDEIGKLTKLQELKFNNNPLQSLPKTIQRLTNVRRVYLQGCELRDLPVELGIAFKDLVYLDLSENKFEFMPALDQMNKLEEFYINGNFLRDIGTSSLNLQTTTTTPAPNSSGTTTGVSGQANNAGSGSVSVGGQTGGAAASQSGNAAGSTQGAGSNGLSSAMASGGLTASKLSELKRLRVFEAQDNQIRALTPKIKTLPCLEVLNLGNNQLTCLPKEVGDIVDLKVLILEGNQIKSLPSTLTRLMGTLEVFRIGEWPENGFEITRDQPAVNMKINVLQTYLPQQIERTMLMRMHDCILKRVQELDSQQYRDQHDQERSNSIGGGTRIMPSQHKASGSTYSLGSGVPGLNETAPKPHYGLTPGLAIAAHNMITNRSFGLSGSDDVTRSPLLTVNSEGINQSYVDHPHTSIRNLPSLQLSGLRSHSSPITTLPMSTSPQTTTPPTGPMSSFPLLNSLRPRKSQQLSTKNSQGAGTRPRTIYGPNSQPSEQEPPSRLSRVFDIGNGSKPKNDGVYKVATLESSSIDLSTETMLALGLGTQLESAGNVSAHSSGSRLGDGSLANIKSSMAIKSTPSLSSVPLSLMPPRPSSPAMTGVATSSRTLDDRANKGALSRGPGLLRRSSSSIGASTEGQSSEKSTASAWMKLKSGTVSFGSTQENSYQQQQSDPASGSSSNASLQQPTVNGLAISAPAPPPIFLDCKFDTPSMAGIPHLYSAGEDDVDGDHPIEGAGMDDETEDDRSSSTTAGGDLPHGRNKGKARMADTPERVSEDLYAQWHQSYNQHQSSNLMNATDPVLKIAVLKQIYDQILGSMDTLVEQSVQESPAKKNNRFKLLNTLRFLKTDRSGSGGLNAVPSGYHPFPAMMQ
ncbi:hypothetical protein BGX34_011370 [Mortierella sp. NVP85]|nr:hypothetical protein BGX34_011370 [Mortierella sp. NVP85]